MNENQLRQPQGILLLTERVAGYGHLRAAENIATALHQHRPTYPVQIRSVLEELTPALAKLLTHSYRGIINQVPRAWGRIHGWNRLRPFGREGVWSRWLAIRLQEWLEKEQPALICCTHAAPLGALAYLKRNGSASFHLATVFTDFQVHPYWIYEEVDSYYVPTPWQRQQLLQSLQRRGGYQGRVEVTGIPIHPAFRLSVTEEERYALRKRYGFNPQLPLLLCMAGGHGEELLQELMMMAIQSPQGMEWLFITGKNERLYQKLKRMKEGAGLSHIHLLSFVQEMESFMGVADAVISKGGGLTTAEVLASGLPLFIYKPLPGQEEANCAFLSQFPQVWITRRRQELEQALIAWREGGERKPEHPLAWGDADHVAQSLLTLLKE